MDLHHYPVHLYSNTDLLSCPFCCIATISDCLTPTFRQLRHAEQGCRSLCNDPTNSAEKCVVNGHGGICLICCVVVAARIVHYVLRHLLLALLWHLRCNLGFRQLPAALVSLDKPFHLQSDLILSQVEEQCCTTCTCVVHSDPGSTDA